MKTLLAVLALLAATPAIAQETPAAYAARIIAELDKPPPTDEAGRKARYFAEFQAKLAMMTPAQRSGVGKTWPGLFQKGTSSGPTEAGTEETERRRAAAAARAPGLSVTSATDLSEPESSGGEPLH